jgi:hypothetical protein
MPNYDDLNNFPTTPQGSRDAGRYEAGRYDKPAPQQPGERIEDVNRRRDEFDKTKNGG